MEDDCCCNDNEVMKADQNREGEREKERKIGRRKNERMKIVSSGDNECQQTNIVFRDNCET
jgi:hypothetical protein